MTDPNEASYSVVGSENTGVVPPPTDDVGRDEDEVGSPLPSVIARGSIPSRTIGRRRDKNKRRVAESKR